MGVNKTMREKKDYVVLTFRTTTDAMATEKRCGEESIPGRLIPIPREITAGCGLAWRMLPQEYEGNLEKLDKLGISFEKIVKLAI
jgi:hypothetical protein